MNAQSTQRFNTGQLALLRALLPKKNRSDQGLTLIESLVAITVAAVIITAITPPIFMSVGTRIQNRRAEQALHLAQGEVDRVRRLVELGDYNETMVPNQPERNLPPVGGNDVKTQAAPTEQPTREAGQVTATKGLLVDVNGDGRDDFVVQTYRSPGIQLNNQTVAFDIGVRVYSAAITQNLGGLTNPPNRVASLQMTTALGSQRRLPLAVMYTSVIRSDTQNSLCNYNRFINNNQRPAWCPQN